MPASPTTTGLSGLLLYGTLESLLNQVLTAHSRGRDQLAALDGTVVRLRGDQPRWVLYVLIYADGIELLTDYEGQVDIRIRAPLGALLHWLLAPNSSSEELRITGPEDLLLRLERMISEFSLWPLVRNWLDDHVRLHDLLALLRREDPAWLERLATLPTQVGELAAQLADQRLLQEDLLNELRQMRLELRRSRRLDLAFLLVGLGLISAAFMRVQGDWHSLWQTLSHDYLSLTLLSLGLALLLGRLWGNKKSS